MNDRIEPLVLRVVFIDAFTSIAVDNTVSLCYNINYRVCERTGTCARDLRERNACRQEKPRITLAAACRDVGITARFAADHTEEI